jgi:hypothetical protein
MAEDLIELGIEGIDKLVDKHFHKLPDKYIDPHTYNPRRWHRHGDGKESGGGENEPRTDYEDSTRKIKGERNSAAVRGDAAYSPEREQSYNTRQRQRTSLPPAPSASDSRRAYEYVIPPPTSNLGLQANRRRKRRDGLVRRCSSQPGTPRDNDRKKTRGEREQDRRRRRSFSDERRRDIVGVEKENRNGRGQNKTEKVMLALLGAAVGGLAVRAVIDKLDRKSGKGDDMRSGGRVRTSGGDGRGGGDEKQVVKGRGRR